MGTDAQRGAWPVCSACVCARVCACVCVCEHVRVRTRARAHARTRPRDFQLPPSTYLGHRFFQPRDRQRVLRQTPLHPAVPFPAWPPSPPPPHPHFVRLPLTRQHSTQLFSQHSSRGVSLGMHPAIHRCIHRVRPVTPSPGRLVLGQLRARVERDLSWQQFVGAARRDGQPLGQHNRALELRRWRRCHGGCTPPHPLNLTSGWSDDGEESSPSPPSERLELVRRLAEDEKSRLAARCRRRGFLSAAGRLAK